MYQPTTAAERNLWLNSCVRKRTYMDPSHAHFHAWSQDDMITYACLFCDGFHRGHEPSEAAQKVIVSIITKRKAKNGKS